MNKPPRGHAVRIKRDISWGDCWTCGRVPIMTRTLANSNLALTATKLGFP